EGGDLQRAFSEAAFFHAADLILGQVSRESQRQRALMTEQFEDVSRWPLGRYFREVVAVQPAGRLLLFAGKVNWGVGLLIASLLLFLQISQRLAWVHA